MLSFAFPFFFDTVSNFFLISFSLSFLFFFSIVHSLFLFLLQFIPSLIYFSDCSLSFFLTTTAFSYKAHITSLIDFSICFQATCTASSSSWVLFISLPSHTPPCDTSNDLPLLHFCPFHSRKKRVTFSFSTCCCICFDASEKHKIYNSPH